jgi:hypothetical protein
LRCVARYSTPPASVFTSTAAVPAALRACPVTIRPLEPAGGSRLPWKSLNDSSWMSIVGPFEAAFEVPPVRAAAAAASAATAAMPDSRRVRDMVMESIPFVRKECRRWPVAAR